MKTCTPYALESRQSCRSEPQSPITLNQEQVAELKAALNKLLSLCEQGFGNKAVVEEASVTTEVIRIQSIYNASIVTVPQDLFCLEMPGIKTPIPTHI